MKALVEREKLGKDGVPPDLDDWYIPPDLIDAAFEMYINLKASDWKLLPNAGGLMDQDEGLMQAVFTLAWLHEVIDQNYEFQKASNKVFGHGANR